MKYKASHFLDVIPDSGGFVTTIAKKVGCTRGTVYNAIKKYPTVAQAIQDEKEKLKDLTEGALLSQIKGGNTTAIIFYLKTQAKDRGYVERVEQEHSGEVNTISRIVENRG